MSEETPLTPRSKAWDLGTFMQLHKDGKLANRCVEHPTYRGIRRPRVDCAACRWLYEAHNA